MVRHHTFFVSSLCLYLSRVPLISLNISSFSPPFFSLIKSGSCIGDVRHLTNTDHLQSAEAEESCHLFKIPSLIFQEFRKVICEINECNQALLNVRVFGKHCHLNHILGHQIVKESFRSYLREKVKPETLFFLIELKELKQEVSQSGSNEQILILFEKFINKFVRCDNTTSNTPVNFTDEFIRPCLSAFEALGKSSFTEGVSFLPLLDALDRCDDEVYENLLPLNEYLKSKQFEDMLCQIGAYSNVFP